MRKWVAATHDGRLESMAAAINENFCIRVDDDTFLQMSLFLIYNVSMSSAFDVLNVIQQGRTRANYF